MKGAILDWISSVADRIRSANIIQYTTRYELADLQDDSLVTKYLLLNNISPTEPIVTPIVGGTTPNPISVNYGAMEFPTLIFRNADGSNYAGATNNVDDGTAITLTGDDDGSGHFADSFTFVIKP